MDVITTLTPSYFIRVSAEYVACLFQPSVITILIRYENVETNTDLN